MIYTMSDFCFHHEDKTEGNVIIFYVEVVSSPGFECVHIHSYACILCVYLCRHTLIRYFEMYEITKILIKFILARYIFGNNKNTWASTKLKLFFS